jgi:hypothetical protein
VSTAGEYVTGDAAEDGEVRRDCVEERSSGRRSVEVKVREYCV